MGCTNSKRIKTKSEVNPVLPSQTEKTLDALSSSKSTTIKENKDNEKAGTLAQLPVQENGVNYDYEDADVVTAPPPDPPQFSEPVNAVAVEKALSKLRTAQEARSEVDAALKKAEDTIKKSLEEVPKEKKKEQRKSAVTILAQFATEDKEAFLADRNRLKAKRREMAHGERVDNDDTLYEQPTRMPEVDYTAIREHSTATAV